MKNIKSHLRLLGLPVTDKVTGLGGIVTSISFDLYGCIQALVNPGVDDQRKIIESRWFDVNRLSIINDTPVMTPPNFDYGPQAEGNSGCAEKPKYTGV